MSENKGIPTGATAPLSDCPQSGKCPLEFYDGESDSHWCLYETLWSCQQPANCEFDERDFAAINTACSRGGHLLYVPPSATPSARERATAMLRGEKMCGKCFHWRGGSNSGCWRFHGNGRWHAASKNAPAIERCFDPHREGSE